MRCIRSKTADRKGNQKCTPRRRAQLQHPLETIPVPVTTGRLPWGVRRGPWRFESCRFVASIVYAVYAAARRPSTLMVGSCVASLQVEQIRRFAFVILYCLRIDLMRWRCIVRFRTSAEVRLQLRILTETLEKRNITYINMEYVEYLGTDPTLAQTAQSSNAVPQIWPSGSSLPGDDPVQVGASTGSSLLLWFYD